MSSLQTGLCLLFTVATCSGFLFDVTTDCLVSTWNTWTDIPGSGIHIRERAILRYDNKGGIPCPSDSELMEIKQDASYSINSPVHIQATARSISTNFLRRQAPIGRYRDLLIVLDSSGSIGRADFTRTKQNLAELMGMLCPYPDPFAATFHHAALIDFSNSVMEVFDFNKYGSTAALKRAILAVPQFAGITCTTRALDAADQMLATWKGMRADTEKEILILTDGHSNCGGNVLASAMKLRVKATVFSLLIGTFSQSGLQEILSYVTSPAPNHLFAVPTHRGLDDLMKLLRSQASLTKCMPFVPPSNG